MSYTIEIIPDLGAASWQPQYPGDTPKWHRAVSASSPESALRCMESVYPGCPKRIVAEF
jgi:hypothetical protein